MTSPARASGPAIRRLLAVALPALLLLALAASPPPAAAHAQLLGAEPADGTVVASAPGDVAFRFSEPVQGTDDAIRVLDPTGDRVDRGPASHPGGDRTRLGVALSDDLRPGTYTATYRVTSADGHPVAGGATFSVGHPSATTASLDDAVRGAESGPVTRTAFSVVRAVEYLATALGVGGLAIALLVLRPAGLGLRRARPVVLTGAALGAVAAAGGVVLQGAEIAGTSFWSALEPGTLGDALDSRFGVVWAVAAWAWLLLAVLARPLLADRPPAAARAATLAAALPAAWILLLPSLAGHASTQSPRGVLFVSLLLHVTAMALWVGGLALLVTAVPRALAASAADQRAGRLAAVASRFSRLAIWAVAAVALSGAVQGYVLVREPHALLDTGHGRAVLVKTLLLAAIAALATRNHRRTVPDLRRAAAGALDAAAAAGRLRRLVRGELALLLAVFVATGALSTSQPAIAIPPGPFSTERTIGPLRATIAIEPARIGTNRVRIALRGRDGRPFTGARAVELSERPPTTGAAALQQTASDGGAPGVHVVDAAPLTVDGRWRVALTVRVSDFDQYETRFDVEVHR